MATRSKTIYPMSKRDFTVAIEATGVQDATKAYRVYHLTLYAATIGRQKRSSAGWLATVANVQKSVLKGLRAK